MLGLGIGELLSGGLSLVCSLVLLCVWRVSLLAVKVSLYAGSVILAFS